MFSNMAVNLSVFDWQAVEAIATWVTVFLNIFLLATVWFGFRSLKESALSRDASSLIWAFQCMNGIKEDLGTIQCAQPYGTLSDIKSPSFVTPWKPEVEEAAYRVSVELQRLSYFANSGLISKVHLQKMWGPTFAEAWRLLEVWVKNVRLRNGEPLELNEGAFSRNDFEKFARECSKA